MAALAKQLFVRFPGATYLHGAGRVSTYNLPIYSGLREFLGRLHTAVSETRDRHEAQAGGG